MNLGKAIKELRKAKNMSQTDLVHRAKITQARLSQIENGDRPGEDTLRSICEALEVSEAMVYIMAIEKKDVSAEKKDMYDKFFPIIKGLVMDIA